MKKTLKISLDNNKYIIKNNDKKMEVSKDDLMVKAEDLYETIFSDVILGEKLEIEYELSGIDDSADKRICSDLQSIINSVKDKINTKVISTSEENNVGSSEKSLGNSDNLSL